MINFLYEFKINLGQGKFKMMHVDVGRKPCLYFRKKGCLNSVASDDKNLVCERCRPQKFPGLSSLPYGKIRHEPTRYRHDPLGSPVPSHLVLPSAVESPHFPPAMVAHIQPRLGGFGQPMNEPVTAALEQSASQTFSSQNPINLSQVYPPSYLGQSPYSPSSFPVATPGAALGSAFGQFGLRDKE
jgi:hypothetical protein